MALEKHRGNASRISITSTSFLSETHLRDGLNSSSPFGMSAVGSLKGASSESLLDGELVQRRKSHTRPRLPSFKGLGISSLGPQSTQDCHILGTSRSVLDGRVIEPSCPGSVGISAPRPGSTPLLTPPADLDSLKWTASPVATPSAGSKAKAKLTLVSDTVASVEGASLSENGAQNESVSLGTSEAGEGDSRQESTENSTTPFVSDSSGSTLWLGRSVGATGEHVFDLTHVPRVSALNIYSDEHRSFKLVL